MPAAHRARMTSATETTSSPSSWLAAWRLADWGVRPAEMCDGVTSSFSPSSQLISGVWASGCAVTKGPHSRFCAG